MPGAGYKFRLAEPADAPFFAKWAAENPQIDPADIDAGLQKNNPTSTTFAVENEKGEVVAFAPFYCQFALAHLGFNPDARAAEKMIALNTMLDGAMAFAVQFGIREIVTLSKPDYGVAKWATEHGFDCDDRQQFKFDINKVLVPVETEAA